MTPNTDTFATRVLSNDAFRKGVAGAVAGTLIAVITEVIWPAAR